MRRETEVMIKAIWLVLVIFLLVSFGPMLLEKLMEAVRGIKSHDKWQMGGRKKRQGLSY